MDKTVICSNIVVYHNALEKYSEALSIMKQSEKIKEKIYHLPPAQKWLMYGSITQVDGSMDENLYNKDEDSEKQKKIFKEIHDVYNLVCKDFFANHLKEKDFPKFINNFDRENGHPWTTSGISFLKYDIKDEDYYKNEAEITHNRTMGYHTDTQYYDSDSRGNKLIVTVTMYLNDEYDGGEICFLDASTGKQYYYKPKPGDVTVFPSGEPYWHSVLPSYNAERFLLRMFCMYDYPGSKEWLDNESKFGVDNWSKMERERKQKVWDEGLARIIIVYPEEEEPKNSPYKVLKINSEPIKVVASIDQNHG